MSYEIQQATPADDAQIEALLDRTFGYDRKQRTSYRLRDGIAPLPRLSFVARHADGGLLASIRYWPIRIARTPAILLGPLAVEPALQGQGYGKALVRHSLSEAKRQGHRLCVVIGAPGYYEPFGFVSAPAAGLVMPGPVAPERFQVLALRAGALAGLHGVLGRTDAADPESDRAPRRA
ncbi:GNAT family N-acetyltransferase [Algihabitans albus]|uniref:GNAT family N-acetyltransferase n=1 Tax=Algihabitans albus TaxID=2164067 RepID=UPI000E5D5CC9|nr:N-acetyltransferase [Algihabitans albus]